MTSQQSWEQKPTGLIQSSILNAQPQSTRYVVSRMESGGVLDYTAPCSNLVWEEVGYWIKLYGAGTVPSYL